MEPQNINQFNRGEVIQSVYSEKFYTVSEPDKGGMAKLKNEYGSIETWNAHNNPHFVKAKTQLELFQ